MRQAMKWAAGLALGLFPVAVLAGPGDATPATGGQNPPAMMTPAPSPPIPDATIGKAGGALRDIASVQEKYQPKMDSAQSSKEKQGLAEQANAEAVQAIQSHGLSVQEYSNVVRTAQTDPGVKQRLLDAANKE